MKKKKKPPGSQVPSHAPQGATETAVPSPPEGEEAEPTVRRVGVPVFFIVILGLLLYWGDMYLMENGADVMGKTGSFPSLVYFPLRNYQGVEDMNPKSDETRVLEIGKRVFQACAQCHQPNGEGSRSLNFPPLAGSEWVLAEGPNRIVRIVLHGLSGPISVKGEQYNNSMASLGSFNDQEIAAVLTYVRQAFGNKAASVTSDEVKAIRAATSDRANPWTTDELMQVQVK